MDKKLQDLMKEFDKKAVEFGFEDLMRRGKFEAMLKLIPDNQFKKRDLLVLYILLDEDNPTELLQKWNSYIKTAKDNLDDISLKDLKQHLLKIGDFKT